MDKAIKDFINARIHEEILVTGVILEDEASFMCSLEDAFVRILTPEEIAYARQEIFYANTTLATG